MAFKTEMYLFTRQTGWSKESILGFESMELPEVIDELHNETAAFSVRLLQPILTQI